MGRAGIVLGLEVSRLARNSTDWHRLLEICALTSTLIMDEDGIYDPAHFNDRLLLGLKGTMSEAELPILHARLQGGLINKARRGELEIPLPVGFAYDVLGRVVLDPDSQVQETVRMFFQTFQRTGSARSTIKTFRNQGILFPRRLRRGVNKGELHWGLLGESRALSILHNPRYAGAFVFGRRRFRKKPDGKYTNEFLPQEQWQVLIKDAHQGYISWQEYEENQQQLKGSAQAYGSDRRRSPPREGPALIQGLVVCGICGNPMTVRYHMRMGKLVPSYLCQKRSVNNAEPICQSIPGAKIDQAIGEILLAEFTAKALEATLAIQQQLQTRIEEADRLRHKAVERARYEADLAQRRYLQVDPANRLVADVLEADWNDKLRVLAETQREYERRHQTDQMLLNEEQKTRIISLASN